MTEPIWKRNSLLIIAIAIFALQGSQIAWTIYSTFVVTFPRNLKDPFLDVVTTSNESYQCIAHRNIMIVDGVTDFDKVMAIIKDQGFLHAQPILFKKFLPDYALRLEKISTMYKDSLIVFTEVQLEAFGNLWLEGRRPLGHVQTSLGDALSATSRSDGTSLFASFVTFLDKRGVDIALKQPNIDIVTDTNFISNFAHDVVSSRFHAAVPIESFAMQLQGKKLWVFMPPHQTQQYSPIGHGPSFLTSGSELQYFASQPYVYATVQEAGDLLYFPPQWAHAVITQAGPNFMLNMRRLAFGLSLYINPFRFVEWAMGKAIHSYQLQYDQFNLATLRGYNQAVSRYYQRMYGLNGTFGETGRDTPTNGWKPPDSPCKDKWVRMLKNDDVTA